MKERIFIYMKKLFNTKESHDTNENSEAAPSIEELKQRVLSNKKKAEDQKQAIVIKIEELKEELRKPKQIKRPVINSFSIEDIEKSTEPAENRQEIASKIASLMVASELPIYCDKEYMDSIHDYLKAIRPEVAKLEKKQYEELNLKRQKEIEAQNYINQVLGEYYKTQNQILSILDVVHGLGWLGPHYNKLHNYPVEARSFTDIIDDVVKINDGKRLNWYISMH